MPDEGDQDKPDDLDLVETPRLGYTPRIKSLEVDGYVDEFERQTHVSEEEREEEDLDIVEDEGDDLIIPDNRVKRNARTIREDDEEDEGDNLGMRSVDVQMLARSHVGGPMRDGNVRYSYGEVGSLAASSPAVQRVIEGMDPYRPKSAVQSRPRKGKGCQEVSMLRRVKETRLVMDAGAKGCMNSARGNKSGLREQTRSNKEQQEKRHKGLVAEALSKDPKKVSRGWMWPNSTNKDLGLLYGA